MAAPATNQIPISQLGEQEMIRRFFANGPVPQPGATAGIGDDCAVLDMDEGRCQLISTDQLLEGVHFLQPMSSPSDIGHKAAAVNFSDIAAMGGHPTGIFLSLGLPPSTTVSWLEDFSNGFNRLGKKYHTPLLGGDTTRSSHHIVVNVMVLGRLKKENLKLRSAARPGDIACVTGTLGDTAAGLRLLQDESKYDVGDEAAANLTRRHRRPAPGVQQGRWLGAQSAVHAMIDLSDGLATDGTHIAKSSELEMQVEVNRIPLSDSFKKFTSGDHKMRKDLSLSGGEDYHLLCTIDREAYDKLSRKFEREFSAPLFRIGVMEEARGPQLRVLEGGREIESPAPEFNHF